MDLLTTILTSGAVTALLIWLTKAWISERLKHAIKHEYDEKLETYKVQMKAQADVELEKLRADLKISATEHELRFTALHEKRAETVAETYALLKELFYRLADYVKIFEPAGDKPKEERRKAAADSHAAFRTYYSGRLIFFPKATAGKLEAIDQQFVRSFNEFVFGVEMRERVRGDGSQKWLEIFSRLDGEIKVALGELEDEFRKMMGDES